MKLQIELFKFPWKLPHWEPDPPHVVKLCDRMCELFAAYGPKRLAKKPNDNGYHTHEMTIVAGDPQVQKLIKQFAAEVKKSKPKAAGVYTEILTPEEVKRARFLELFVSGDDVDEDASWEPLNQQPVLCEKCQYPDLDQVPKPFLVNKGVLKKQDVFRVGTGMLIVRPHVAELFKSAIANQIEIGEAVLAGAKKKATGDDRLFWIRPRQMIGEQLAKRLDGRCRACKRFGTRVFSKTPDAFVNEAGTGLHDKRRWVEHFGNGDADLALLGGFNGSLHRDEQPNRRWWYWPIAISGALITYLKSNGVKGIAVSPGSDPVQCFISQSGEPMLEAEPRTFGGATKATKRSRKKDSDPSRVEEGRKIVASLSKVPWDCDKDGYVHFYLTSPELMVLDPMTWEDSGAPYKVKSYRKPGVYRIHVAAIKNAANQKRGVAVDSGTLLFVDNAYFANLQEVYDWDESTNSNGSPNKKYHEQVSKTIGNRFGVCTTPPRKFKSAFVGDGFYSIDVKAVERAE